MAGGLKLRARDTEDFGVVAALLQDALVPIADMAYLPEERRFVLVVNRFRWESAGPETGAAQPEEVPAPMEDVAFAEDEAEPKPHFERVHCGLRFERVTAVRMKGINRRARDQILALLTLQAEERAIDLVFAGDATIRLEVEALHCDLEDLGEAWPTRWRPQHALEEGEEGRERE